MPLTDHAYFNGKDLPRCAATPGTADIAADRLMRRDTWQCSLPAGHATFDNPRHHPHAWVMTGEDD